MSDTLVTHRKSTREDLIDMSVTALDIGYGWTKGKHGNVLFRQPSILGDIKQLHEENMRNGYIIFEDYFVGELALKHSDVKYYCLKDSKANTWTTKILAQTALAYLKSSNTNVVTGLPVDFYFNQKDDFENLLEDINGSRVWIEILGDGKYQEYIDIKENKIVPQPLGAAMDYLLDDNSQLTKKEEARGRILVIDWGRYTLDFLILDGMEIHRASSSPPDIGIEAAYYLLRRYLRERFGKAPATYQMDSIVQTGIYERHDVKPLIDTAFRAIIQQIQLEVEGLNMSFSKHLLVGGQAERLNHYLDIPDKVEGHQLSNLNGYEKIGRRSWDVI